tara:strand:+ start:102 stop:311 length:210 start_codon:yes stop_codon:yes gene_type:complete
MIQININNRDMAKEEIKCIDCDGTGYIASLIYNLWGNYTKEKECDDCWGTGIINMTECLILKKKDDKSK